MSRDQDFITEARDNARKIWEAITALKGLQREWTALDYGTTLVHGEGENSKLNVANVGSVVFDTTNAIEEVLNAGHATNLGRLL